MLFSPNNDDSKTGKIQHERQRLHAHEMDRTRGGERISHVASVSLHNLSCVNRLFDAIVMAAAEAKAVKSKES